MDELLAARLTMAVSLGFHIIFASIGMAMPFLMSLAHRNWLKTGDEDAYRLTRLWMRGTAIFFATGAVSGTALSFELGLLWPEFMRHAGPIIGMPFSLEGAAFFVEAIALGIYMYGWERLSPRLHWAMGLVVGLAGVSSGMLVIAANGWMNAPTGFTWDGTQATNIDPIAAMLNPAWATQSIHMAVAAFQSLAFVVVGIHAILLLRGGEEALNRLAIRLTLPILIGSSIIQPMIGHWAAQDIAERQPLKLAAMEAHFKTESRASLVIGGLPDVEAQRVDYAIKIPGALSFLAFNDFDATVRGLEEFPRDEWPPITIVHFAFQIMVGLGTAMAGLAGLALMGLLLKKPWLWDRRLLMLWGLMAPAGFIAIEAGWVVTEVGRQPWIIYGIMKTEDAVSPFTGQVWHLVTFVSLYLGIGLANVMMWWNQVSHGHLIGPPSTNLEAWRRGESDSC